MTDIECRSIATFDQLVQTFADRAGDHHIRAEGVHRVYTNGLFSVSSALEKLRIAEMRQTLDRVSNTLAAAGRPGP